MAATDIEICNLALDNLGVTNKVASISAPTTKEERACARWYAIVRDLVLGDLPWPFASRTVEMTEDLVETHPMWAVVNETPSDFLKARLVFTPQDRLRTPLAPFQPFLDSTKTRWLIGCDEAGMWLEYTMKFDTNDLVALMPAGYVDALGFALAARLVTPLALDKSLIKEMDGMHSIKIARAFASDVNGVRFDPPRDPDYIRERG